LKFETRNKSKIQLNSVGDKKLKEILSWKKPRKSNTAVAETAAMVDGIAAMGHGWSIVRVDLHRLLVASLPQVLTTRCPPAVSAQRWFMHWIAGAHGSKHLAGLLVYYIPWKSRPVCLSYFSVMA
jgi:hypothetical protein